MTDSIILSHLQRVRASQTARGGFADRPDGQYRPDCTAWAILILQTQTQDTEQIDHARARLAAELHTDGRLCISPEHPDAIWPTPLAILAWTGASAYQDARTRAIQFLLQVQGTHWEKDPTNTIIGHDPSIPGWPWVMQTHSWVYPTALSIVALTSAGIREHPRIHQGIQLLLDRQLAQGGWNYGNTTVWGRELHPFPETTGIALNALAGHVPSDIVARSLAYLLEVLPSIRTPLSLGWGLLGLSAWRRTPAQAAHWISECLARQRRYGEYETVSLCVLLAAALAPRGLSSLLPSPGESESRP
ncbi:MAG: hypothetical protein D6690_04340 [Nitrospirae bacterium]|nr:MAG: hypothetical protein D6690_04340 [Nitrospirota bacterium]